MIRNIVLTGATGFVGSHLLPMLLKAKYRVTCIVRATSDISRLPNEVQIKTCDLATGNGLVDALEGQDVFIHLAALLFGLGWNEYLTANTQAAQNIAQAMSKLGDAAPKKIVHISSMAATGPYSGHDGVKDNELPKPVSAYGWSKLLVERTLSTCCQNLLILRPSIIYGSGDRGLLPLIQGIKYGFAVSPGLRTFPVSCVHASDVAQAICASIITEHNGIYHVSDGQCHSMDEFCVLAGKALGKTKMKVLHIPLPLMAISAWCTTLVFQLLHALPFVNFKRMPNWNMDKYREAAQCGWVCNCQRLIQDLGYEPKVGLEEGLRETVAGYQARGWL